MSAPIKVAVLDDYQSLSTKAFSKLPSKFQITTFNDTLPSHAHPSTTEAQKSALVNRLQPFEVICTMRERTPFPGSLIRQLPNLKCLLTTGMRNNALDLPAFKEAGVAVYGTKGKGADKARAESMNAPAGAKKVLAGPDSTTQHCIALILGVARNLATDHAAVIGGEWQNNVTTGLNGKTLGLVGFGRLGVAVAKIMYSAFGMKIVAWSSSLTQEACDEKAVEAGFEKGAFTCVSKEEVMGADVVSVHYVLSDRSRGVVGKTELANMKESAFLINTSRGPLVDESALLQTLKEGRIRGAAIDVYNIEPLPLDSEWRTTRWGVDGKSKVLLTPHTGYVEYDTMKNWYEETVDNLLRYGVEDLHNSMIV